MEDRNILQPKSEGVFKINTENQVASEKTTLALGWLPTASTYTRQPILNYENQAFILRNLLSQQECQHIIELGEELGLKSIQGARDDYRTSLRICLTDPALADLLYVRAKAELDILDISENSAALHVHGCLLKGTWQPSHLNPLFRLCRYESGGHFAPHFDGYYRENAECRSFKTLMVYLNADFTAGYTNFIDDQQQLYKDSTGRYCAEERNILYALRPEAGSALIFNHHRLHEGAALSSGVKYILRTDVMYRRTDKPEVSENESRALLLLQDAERLEAEGRGLEAVPLYKKAFRLCPTLEDELKS